MTADYAFRLAATAVIGLAFALMAAVTTWDWYSDRQRIRRREDKYTAEQEQRASERTAQERRSRFYVVNGG